METSSTTSLRLPAPGRLALEGQSVSRTRHTGVWHPEPRPGRVRSLSWEYADGHRVPPHAHAWHQLLYAVRGVMTLSAAGGSWIVPVHRGAWVPAGMENAIRLTGAVSMRKPYIDTRVEADLQRALVSYD